MIPVISRYDCLEHDPIDRWVPPDPKDVEIRMTFVIGSTLQEGDYFEALVVTPNRVPVKGARRPMVVVDSFSVDAVQTEMRKLLKSCEGETWAEVSAKLNLRLIWEFDNYNA